MEKSSHDASQGGPESHAKGVRAGLVLGALGVVFGDIGTSPLYTLQECLGGEKGYEATHANVFGILSLIFWSLTLVVTVKYLSFLMRADNRGEGGIMALLALVPERERSPAPGRVGGVAVLVIAGAALLFGDGIVTPAISVLSAVEGIGVATSSLKSYVVPITVVILFGLFLIQRRGTGDIGRLFGPVMLLWFSAIGALGVRAILLHPQVLGALAPHHAISFFTRHGVTGARVLGGVVLAVTGGEALYADMGHFGRNPIRIAWLVLVFPSLVLCYFGQGALIVSTGHMPEQLFFALIPSASWIYPLVGLATLATVIASQALISGVFSLTNQAIRLGYLPRLTIKHTSGEAEGQIYVPFMNWGLAIACIALVIGFRESSRLAAAYGLAVSGTMGITSIVFYVVTRHRWGWSRGKSLAVLVLFLSFDIPFLLANMLKFFDGGYLPFLVGVAFVIAMASWRIGRGFLGEYLKTRSLAVDRFLEGLDARILGRVPGTAIAMTSLAEGIPPVLFLAVERFRVVYEKTVLLTVTAEHVPTVAESDRIATSDLGKGFYRLILHYGFMETPNVHDAIEKGLAKLRIDTKRPDIVYLLGRETLVVTPKGNMGPLTENVFAVLTHNARSATDYFSIPTEQVVEIGSQVDL